jgi:hypothetical protein
MKRQMIEAVRDGLIFGAVIGTGFALLMWATAF